ncbi:mitochondrial 37S ribosomal protein uS11m MRPS18 [Ascoidea rubescens DSM 1968]|uniref:Small ribosomal subunit protein uS11m n=1 Tax=Ascoidea rubescens DSM 1968 TaxID=1344418 RepID=A0A1D2V9I6_9ASCO|nr:translational machinery component [Ascoidea rubescens DSM 1968]ODV58341.1 translational machinery component [Ascoidea rubescens DSM 1968]
MIQNRIGMRGLRLVLGLGKCSEYYGKRFISSGKAQFNEETQSLDSLLKELSKNKEKNLKANKSSVQAGQNEGRLDQNSADKDKIPLNKNIGNNIVVKRILHCYFKKNNTFLTLTSVLKDPDFLKKNPEMSYNDKMLYFLNLPERVNMSLSTGQLGFRKAARGEYEAAFQVCSRMFQMMRDNNLLDVDLEVVLKEFGKGRNAFQAALFGKEGNHVRAKVVRLSDDTKLKFGGCRARRPRRL